MADLADVRRANVTHSVAVGESFRGSSAKKIHTLRYNFKPEKADFKRGGKLKLQGASVELSVPSTSGGQLVLSGNSEPHKEVECALICDAGGSWRIEKLDRNIKNLKQERTVTGGGRRLWWCHSPGGERVETSAGRGGSAA